MRISRLSAKPSPCRVAGMAALMLSGALLTPAGCAAPDQPPLPKLSAGSTHYRKTSAMYGGLDGGMFVLVWTNVTGNAHCGGTGPGQDGDISYRGTAKSNDGRQVEWECRTPDGQAGQVRLADKTYSLVKGAVFLVTVKGGQTTVRQLRRDVRALPPARATIEALARDDAEVAAFVAAAEKAE